MLGTMQHPLPKLIEACSPVGLPLEQLQSMNMSLNGPLGLNQREPCFHGIVVSLESPPQNFAVQRPLLFHLLEPGVQLFALPFSQHRSEELDHFIRLGNLLVRLAEAGQVLFLPIKTLFLFKRDSVSDLQSSGRTLFRAHIGMDHQIRLGLDRFELTGLAFERSPGSDKTAHSGIGASISLASCRINPCPGGACIMSLARLFEIS